MQNHINYSFLSCFFFQVIILLNSQPIIAQQIGFQFTTNRSNISIPFESYNNLIVVSAIINENIPLSLILDTGVGTTIITERTVCEDFDLTSSRCVSLPVLGTQNTINARILSNTSIRLPGVLATGQNILILEEDYLNLKNFLGVNVHGIMGKELFKYFAVKINYLSKCITLMSHDSYKPPRKFHSIPLILINGKPFIEVNITQENGESFPITLMVDLGASHSMLVDMWSDSSIKLPEKHLQQIVGRGLGGDIHGYVGRVKELKLGEYQFNDLVVSFTESYINNKEGVIPRNGTLGGDILKRFHVIFDYKNHMLYLKKNNDFRKPFYYNLSGLDIIAKGKELHIFEIANVYYNSPAQKTGIQKGDIILSVNGKLSADLTLNEINLIFQSHPGKNIWLKIKRNDQVLTKKFKLEKII